MPPKSQQQREAADKYLKEKVDTIAIRVPKGKKAIIRAHADACGQSLNKYIEEAVDSRMATEEADSDQQKNAP